MKFIKNLLVSFYTFALNKLANGIESAKRAETPMQKVKAYATAAYGFILIAAVVPFVSTLTVSIIAALLLAGGVPYLMVLTMQLLAFVSVYVISKECFFASMGLNVKHTTA